MFKNKEHGMRIIPLFIAVFFTLATEFVLADGPTTEPTNGSEDQMESARQDAIRLGLIPPSEAELVKSTEDGMEKAQQDAVRLGLKPPPVGAPTESQQIEMKRQFQSLIQQIQEDEKILPVEEAVKASASLPTTPKLLQDKHGNVYGIVGIQIDHQSYVAEIRFGCLTNLYGKVWRPNVDKPLFWNPALDVDPDVIRSPFTLERLETPENEARDALV